MKLRLFFSLLCLWGVLFCSQIFVAQAQDSDLSENLLFLVQAKSRDHVQMIESEIGTSDFFKTQTSGESVLRVEELTNQEQQLIRINQSLKNLMDENQKILSDNERLQGEIIKLRGERMVQDSRLTALANERENLLKRSQEIEQAKQDYELKIEELKNELELKMATPQYQEARKIRDLLEQTTGDMGVSPGPQDSDAKVLFFQTDAVDSGITVSKEYRDLEQEIADLLSENQILKKDTVKLHYNLANLFFEQGKYDMAAIGYQRVVTLMPQDAATHYNLAFVAENYLNDKKTALQHYIKYLQLEPNASDATFVKNKISELKMQLKIKIDSLIDR